MAKALKVVAFVAAAGAATSAAEGSDLLITGGLSATAVVSAVGSAFVTREKTRRNERDIEQLAGSVKDIGQEFRTSMAELRGEIKSDLREHRDHTRETIQLLVNTINERADTHRAGDHA